MSARFENLKKLPAEPAARMLARTNTKLGTPLKTPASAPVSVVLAELEAAGAWLDILHLLAVAIPPREATWWACLAGRDLTGEVKKADVPPPLAAAEAWVFQPSDDTRAAAKTAIDTVDPDDDTVYCAMAALYAAGTLGPGDMADYPAPPNAVSAMVQTMNMLSAKANKDRFDEHIQLLIDRGLDIARGGNGNVEAKEAAAAKPTTKSGAKPAAAPGAATAPAATAPAKGAP